MISVAIIDDQRDIREALQKTLSLAPDICCLGAYPGGESAMKGILSKRPHVVLMDIDLSEIPGVECLRALKRALPELNVIVLTACTDDAHIFRSLRAGAYGFFSKNIFPSRLLGAIREVHRGGAPMEAHIARRVVSFFNHNPAAAATDLSKREQDVLHLLCEGRSYKEMARRLYVSPNTIRFHLKNIYKKLDVSSRHEAVAKASRVGIA